jgi:hypothetical protein
MCTIYIQQTIGHCVVLATLNHNMGPAKRKLLHLAPIVIGMSGSMRRIPQSENGGS